MTTPAKGPLRVPVSDAVVLSAEGERVAFVTCLTCGAALLLSTRADTYAIHDAWHATAQKDREVPL